MTNAVAFPTAFWVEAKWGEGLDVAHHVDGRLAERGLVSVATAGAVTAVCFGRPFELPAEVPAGSTPAGWIADRYTNHGLDWLAESAGDFAIVIADRAKSEVLAARNHVGTRPLFVRRAGDGSVRVASNYSGTGTDHEDLNDETVRRFLVGDPPAASSTMLSEVASVQPGHIETVTQSASSSTRYWFPEQAPRLPYRTIDEAAGPLRELMWHVVADHVHSATGLVGAHLTGGIDSSAVVAATVETIGDSKHPTLVTFAWQALNDGPDASIDQRLIGDMIDHFGLECSPCLTEVDDLLGVLALDPAAEPVTSTLRLERVVQVEAEHRGVTTILSGWGGDEFASYNGRHLAQRRRAHVKAWLADRLKRPRRSVRPSLRDGYASPEMRAAWPRPKHESAETAFGEQVRLLGSGGLAERTDSWSVWATGQGFQYGYPLLDRRILDFVFGLPEECFRGHRRLFRALLDGVVPESVRINTDKNERGRTDHSHAVIGALIERLDGDLHVDPARVHFVDAGALLDALGHKHEYRHLGKLMNALAVVHHPSGPLLSTSRCFAEQGVGDD